MKKALLSLLIALMTCVVLAIPFMAGWWIGEGRAFSRFQPHTDTLYIPHDTTIYETVVVEKWHVRTDTVRLASVDTLIAHDSILVEVPIEQKVYQDSLYTAYVSGFRPSLDSIRLTMPTVVITQTVKEPVKAKGLGWGVTAGPSIIYSDRLRAGIGVTAGLTYRF